MSESACGSMTEEQIRETAQSVFGNTSSSSPPPTCGGQTPVPDVQGYETVTNKVVVHAIRRMYSRFHEIDELKQKIQKLKNILAQK